MTRIKIAENHHQESSHRHGCYVTGHDYECSEECECICGLPMNGNDHSDCPIEVRACPEHQFVQNQPISAEELPEVVEIKFPEDWQHTNQPHCQCGCADADSSQVVGWCLWCDHVYTGFTPAIQKEHFAHHCPKARHT
jgi:hypothetical protein